MKKSSGQAVRDMIEIIRKCRESGEPLPAPEPVKGLSESQTRSWLTRHVQGSAEPQITEEEAQIIARQYCLSYDGPRVSRPQRRKPVQKPSEASEHPGHVQGTGNLLAAIIAARVFEIERMKLGGADKNLIAMKEKTLAALIAKSKSSQTL